MRKWHRKLISNGLSTLFYLFYFSYVALLLWRNTLFRWETFDLIPALKLLALGVPFALCLVGFVFLLSKPFFRRLVMLQRLCNMIYSSKFYMVNDFETPNMMKSDKKRMKKDIVYFPKFYSKLQGKQIQITIRLDGSQFHQAGKFKELATVLEELLAVDLVGMGQRKGFFTYSFEADNKKNRLLIDDVSPVGYTIELMKGIVWDIAKVPHALIVGGTGGGKSVFLQILLRAFVKMGAEVRIGDAKFSSILDMEKFFPNVYGDPQDIADMVKATVQEMNDRYKYLRTLPNYKSGEDFTYYNLKPIIVLIDEYVAWLTDFATKKERDAIINDLRQIILKGRAVGVIGVFATQRPDAEYLKGDIRDQLGLRVSLGALGDDGYKMAFGKISQELTNKEEKGRGYIHMTGNFLVREFYSPFVPEGYDYIKSMAELVGVDADDLERSGKIDSQAKDDHEPPSGDYEVREVIYQEVSGYERSE
nr:FtsK/SpoIIIE domain-containing protein [Enterococcus sp. 9E7_DIV0242]